MAGKLFQREDTFRRQPKPIPWFDIWSYQITHAYVVLARTQDEQTRQQLMEALEDIRWKATE